MQKRCGSKAVRKIAVITAVTAVILTACTDPGPQEYMVPMRDNASLATDVYLPFGFAPAGFPVLLMRTPYGKENHAEIGRLFANNGICAVVQDLRGLGASEGSNLLFESDGWRELQDGKDTLVWIKRQKWCNGKIATHGWSALAVPAYLLQGTEDHDGLVYQHIAAAPVSSYDHIYFPGGIFRQQGIEAWLPWLDAQADTVAVLQEHYTKDRYWDFEDLTTRTQYITTPAYHIGGWFDAFQKGTIEAFQAYVDAGADDQHLIIGPWTHDGYYTAEQNELTFPDNAATGYYTDDGDPAILTMISYLLYDDNYITFPAVSYYTMGDVEDQDAPGNAWQESGQFPPAAARATRLSLGADGIASAGTCPDNATLSYTYSTDNYVPTLCGQNLFYRPGPCDVSEIYAPRTDMLFFETSGFSAPTEISGALSFQLKASISRQDTDFIVFIVDVYPDGRQYLMLERGRKARFRSSFSREETVTPGEWFDMTVELGYLSLVLNTGHRLGIYVANTNFPKYKLPSPSEFYWDDTPHSCDVQIDLADTYLTVDIVGGWNAAACAKGSSGR